MKHFGTVAASPRPRVAPLVLAALLLAAPASAGTPAKGDPQRGKAKYDALCVICHGANAKGDGPTARSLDPRPRDLTDAKYMAERSDQYLRDIILKGGGGVGKSPLMPPWNSQLNDADAANVIAYLRSLAKK